MILGGNMRLKALNYLSYKKIPKSWIKQASDLTDKEKEQFIIKDNVGFGDWDWDMLIMNGTRMSLMSGVGLL